MSEMLANQYFMTRRFVDAEPIFRKLVSSDKIRIDLIKKLIICLIQVGKYDNALSLFDDTISKNFNEFISETQNSDDCPCREIIYDLEHSFVKVAPEWREILLGILWLYCDIEISLKYFNESIKNNNSLSKIKSISTILNKEIYQLKSRELQNGKKTD